MKREKELLKNTAIIGIGNFGTKLISFFLLPIYTTLLSTKDYGIYDFLLTISTFLVPIITLLMEESMFRFLIDCNKNEEKENVITNTILFILGSAFIFSIIYFILTLFIKIPYKIIFYFYIISSIFSAVRNALTRGLGKIKLFTITNFITNTIIIILNLLFIIKFNMGISSLLISSIVTNILSSIIIFTQLQLLNYISFKKCNKTKLKEMIKYSVPLVPNSLSWTIVNLSDRFVIFYVLGSNANGIYSISNKFPSMIDAIYGFFYSAWKESAAKTLKDNDSEKFYNDIYVILKNFLWSIVIIVIAVLPLVFDFIIKKDFKAAYLYIPILIVAMYFSNISGYYGGIFSAYKDTKIMGITTVIGAIINLVTDILLIKIIGIWAAAVSTLLSTFIIYIYRKFKLRKYVSLKENNLLMSLNIFTLFIAWLSYYSKNIIIQIIILSILILYAIIINRKIIRALIKTLKNHIKN